MAGAQCRPAQKGENLKSFSFLWPGLDLIRQLVTRLYSGSNLTPASSLSNPTVTFALRVVPGQWTVAAEWGLRAFTPETQSMGPSLVRPKQWQCSLSGSFISDLISTFHVSLGGLVVTPPVRWWPSDQADDRVNRLQPSLASDRHKLSSMRVGEGRGGEISRLQLFAGHSHLLVGRVVIVVKFNEEL